MHLRERQSQRTARFHVILGLAVLGLHLDGRSPAERDGIVPAVMGPVGGESA